MQMQFNIAFTFWLTFWLLLKITSKPLMTHLVLQSSRMRFSIIKPCSLKLSEHSSGIFQCSHSIIFLFNKGSLFWTFCSSSCILGINQSFLILWLHWKILQIEKNTTLIFLTQQSCVQNYFSLWTTETKKLKN